MSEQLSMESGVGFTSYGEKFFRLSGVWLSDPEIRFLTDTPVISEAERSKWVRRLPERGDYLIFGVTFKDMPVGVCGLKNISDSETGEYWGFIGDKAYWGKGIGSEMIKFIESIALERGLRRILLKVIPQNLRAIKLYTKQGFRKLERQPIAQSIMMEKRLSSDVSRL